MALVERIDKPFTKIEELEFQSDNRLLQLLEIQYNKISEASRFNDKYQPIGKGTNKIVETIANSEKTKKAFEFIKGALTLGVIGYAAINNVGITETLGNFTSVIPGIGEGINNVITTPGGNGIITQLLADSSLGSAVTKGIEELSDKKDMIKDFVVDKLPNKIKEKYFERENAKAERRRELEEEYPTDKEIYDSNRDLYKAKEKELIKDILPSKENEKEIENIDVIKNSKNEKVEEKNNPWEVTSEERNKQLEKEKAKREINIEKNEPKNVEDEYGH